jgi:hypothetical protein
MWELAYVAKWIQQKLEEADRSLLVVTQMKEPGFDSPSKYV